MVYHNGVMVSTDGHEMTEVFVIVTGEYDEYYTRAICSSLAEAQKIAATIKSTAPNGVVLAIHRWILDRIPDHEEQGAMQEEVQWK